MTNTIIKWLRQDVVSHTNGYIYGFKGDAVKVVSESDSTPGLFHVTKSGNSFYVYGKHLSDDPIQPEKQITNQKKRRE